MKILDSLITTLNETQNIPHMLFYGEVHSGKRKAVNYLLNHIYSLEERKQYCMFLECATFKGIKVIRDEIKEFAKQQTCNRVFFKSIVLYDAENLTIDQQNTSYSDKLNSLTAAFGSSKKRKAMQTKLKNRLDTETLDTVIKIFNF